MSDIRLSRGEFDQLRNFVQEQCGIALGDEKSYLVETRLSRLVVEAGCSSFGEFHAKVFTDAKSGLREKVIDAMTTNETLWFRDKGPWVTLDKVFLPELCGELESGERKKVRIWSSASSTGQEAYSVALSIHQYLRDTPHPGVKPECFEIVGTDISPSALFVAMSGRYDGLSITRGLDPSLRDSYFEQEGRAWRLKTDVKSMAKFRRFNLMDSFLPLGKFDLILCRNVLIYFSNDLKRDIIGRFAQSMEPKGRLIVGSSESLQGCMAGYAMRQFEGNFFYQLK